MVQDKSKIRAMKVLAIETSCDETAVAILEGSRDDFRIKKNLVASQIKDHAKYGGVVPEIAARKHVDVLAGMLKAAKVPADGKGIDAVAVTYGPGLAPALRVGVEAAKTLATVWDKPLVPVNHLEGHIYSVLLDKKNQLKFPALALIVSGGHTEIVLIKSRGKYKVIGETRDDAAGEAFDKVAKLMNLGYLGGPIVSKLAEKGNPNAIDLPRPMIDAKNFDFSFSGLKTAVLYHLQDHPRTKKKDLAASFEQAVVDVLVSKMVKAIRKHEPKTVLLCGGVSANKKLRSELQRAVRAIHELPVQVAPLKYTGDNAAMIAIAGFYRARNEDFIDPKKIKVQPNLNL